MCVMCCRKNRFQRSGNTLRSGGDCVGGSEVVAVVVVAVVGSVIVQLVLVLISVCDTDSTNLKGKYK